MNWEINVSKLDKKLYELTGEKSYHHLFATTKRSATTRKQAKELLNVLLPLFPAPEYNIMLTQSETRGQILNVENFLQSE